MKNPIELKNTSMFDYSLGSDSVQILVKTTEKGSLINYCYSWSDTVWELEITETDHNKACQYAINHVQ